MASTAAAVDPASSRKRGRPPLTDAARLEQRSLRLTRAQWAKVDTHGLEWLRRLIDRARPAGVSDKTGP